MAAEEAGSPACGGEERRTEEPPQTVYLLPVYAVAIVDPNELVGESGLPVNFRGEATEEEVAVEQTRQKLEKRKRGTILEYDDDDPHKPTPKRLRNRMKSQKSRDKKKAYMDALESKVKELERMISELERKCLALQNENEALKNEALETDPGAVEKLTLYHEKFQKDKENTEKPVEDQEGAPRKTAKSQEGNALRYGEIMDQECIPEIDIAEGTPVTKAKVKCAKVDGLEALSCKFGKADDLECTSEISALESTPLNLDCANSQEGSLRRCTEIRNNNILNVEDIVEQHYVTETSPQ